MPFEAFVHARTLTLPHPLPPPPLPPKKNGLGVGGGVCGVSEWGWGELVVSDFFLTKNPSFFFWGGGGYFSIICQGILI